MARLSALVVLVLLGLGAAGFGAWYLLAAPVHSLATPGPVRASAATPPVPAGESPRASSIVFPAGVRIDYEEVAAEAGIDFKHHDGRTQTQYLMETTPPGLAWLDYDGDGLFDLFLVQGGNNVGPPSDPAPSSKLYRNEGGGRFRDVTGATGLGHLGCGQGAAVGDIDNDGDPDLFVSCYGKPNALYRNEGGKRFVEIAAEAGLTPKTPRPGPIWSTCAAFLDYDNDGFLDLFVGQYVAVDPENYPVCLNTDKTRREVCPPRLFEPSRCALYRNKGDGTFADAGERAGIDLPEAKALGAVALDLDDDGRIDLFVANDGVPNFLFRNLGGGRFESAGRASGCAVDADGIPLAYMGVDADDLDGDGRPDLYVTAYAGQTDTLFRNMGGAQFVDATRPSGLAQPSKDPLSFGVCFVDPDRDGALDVVVVNGHVDAKIDLDGDPNVTFRQRPQLYHNDGRGKFADVSELAGPYFLERHVGRGVGACDFDNDGRLDLAISNSGEPTALLHDRSETPNHWLRLELRGTKSNRDAVGAKVVVTLPGGRTLVRHRKGGGSYLSAGDPRLLVGLGPATRAEGVEVRWPSGLVQRLGPLDADKGYLVTEGSDATQPRP